MRAVHELNEQDLTYFAPSYSEARAKFLEAAEQTRLTRPQAAVESFQVPSAKDQELFVDSLSAPATERRDTLIIITSGVHGIEGYTGSAIQRMFLKEIAPQISHKNIGLFIVHALNPFGFKYLRRATESNVNLNRNFATDPQLFKSENPNYDHFASVLERKKRVLAPSIEYLRTLGLITAALTYQGFTADQLNRGIALGQYRHARGLEYGGLGPEPQVVNYLTRLKGLIEGYKELILLDLHTGLGEHYTLHLIPGDDDRATDPGALNKYFAPLENNPSFAYTPTSAEGFYETLGDMNRVLSSIASPEQRLLSATLEFGTLGNSGLAKIDTLHRVILENQAYHHGSVSRATQEKVTRLFTELFFPSDPKWRMTALKNSRAVLSTLTNRLTQA